MMQKSVYSKLVINNVTSAAVKSKVAENLPPIGIIELLEVTENQFSRIDYLVGERQTLVEESTDRLIEDQLLKVKQKYAEKIKIF